MLSLRTIAREAVLDYALRLVKETARVSARAVALEIAHLPARKNAPVRADRGVLVRAQVRVRQAAESLVEDLAPDHYVKENVLSVAQILVIADVKVLAHHLAKALVVLSAPTLAIMVVKVLVKIPVRVLVNICAAIRAESAAPEQLLCFREPV